MERHPGMFLSRIWTLAFARVTILGGMVVIGCATTSKMYNPPKKMVVSADVTNVRSKTESHSGEYKFDPLQETQLEKGEPVLVHEQAGEWVRVSAPEQIEFSHNSKWEGYPGWVKKKDLTKDLSKHHRIRKEVQPPEKQRQQILENAALHLGNPYLWGGRSIHNPEITNVATGVDCSGLVNWSFRQTGWFIPRDAHEQYLKSRRLEAKELKPGDLVFLAKSKNPNKMVHVMFYSGEEMLLEAPQSGESVRRISTKDRLGKLISKIKNGDQVGDRIVYFGSFFPE